MTFGREDAVDAATLAQCRDAVAAATADVKGRDGPFDPVTLAYQAMLGFYQTHIHDFGWSKQQLVNFANSIVAGMGATEPPALDAGVARKLGLLGLGIKLMHPDHHHHSDGRGYARRDEGRDRLRGDESEQRRPSTREPRERPFSTAPIRIR